MLLISRTGIGTRGSSCSNGYTNVGHGFPQIKSSEQQKRLRIVFTPRSLPT